MSHRNAPLSETGRLRLARCVVEDGWSLRRAAERFQVSPTTAQRWAGRYRQCGPAGMVDRSSRPHRSPGRTPRRRERRIIGLRVTRRWGPARIGYHLRLAPSTVHRVLSRWGLARLSWLDRATGRTVRRPVRRYEHAAPGELLHVDVKKLGKIPDGGGWRMVGAQRGRAHSGQRGRGYHYLHTAIDDHSRLAYSELLTDERQDTAAAFWGRANAWFAGHGVVVRRVLTDNGSCYRSGAFAAALGPAVAHKRTRPYRPQTNGKVERFHRTLAVGWAHGPLYTSEHARRRALPSWLHHYNHHRPHTAIGNVPPVTRLTNLPGQYI